MRRYTSGAAAAGAASASGAGSASDNAAASELSEVFAELQGVCASPELPERPEVKAAAGAAPGPAWGDAAAHVSAKLRALDALLPRLRAERRGVLVVASDGAALDAAAAFLASRRVAHFRLDAGEGLSLGGAVQVEPMKPTFKAPGTKRVETIV